MSGDVLAIKKTCSGGDGCRCRTCSPTRELTRNASQSSSGTSASIGDVYTSMLRTSPVYRRCVWDILNLGVPRRMFADCPALFGDISPMVRGVGTSREN